MNFWKTIKNMITINNSSYNGKTISIVNGKVTIDGKEVNTGDSKEINISVSGNLEKLNVDYCNKIEIAGNVTEVSSTSGNVSCGDVTSDIKTISGDVDCGSVGGKVETVSGDVMAENISGNVKTLSGNIKYKK